jgi:tetratricopeptide (TPR) repeat protein
MNPVGRLANVSDRALDRGLRLGVLALLVGALAFGGIYYRDRHVSAGPSLLDRQVSAAEKAVRAAPGSVPARLALAQAYQADKRLDAAVKQYQQILSANGNHRGALLGLGKALIAKKDLGKANDAFQRIVGLAKPGEFAGSDPQLEEAYYFLGSIAVKQGKPAVALTQLQAALKINPTDSDAWYLTGVATLKTGDAKKAVPALQRALAFVPTGWCEPYAELRQAYSKLGQAPKAEYAGAMSDFCHKRYAQARERLTALTTGPETVDAMLGLGLIAESSSQPDEAVGWYRKVLGKDKTNPTALAALSRLGVAPPASGSAAHPSTATSSRQGA